MADHVSGNPTWQNYPTATTPLSAASLENLEAALDGNNPLTVAGVRTGKLRLARVEAVFVNPNAEFTLMNQVGPGCVHSWWMAIGNGFGPCLDGRLRVYYDGSATPAMDIDIGTLFVTHVQSPGLHSISTVHMHSEINQANGDTGILMTFPMPFGSSIKVTYFNPSAAPALIFSMLAYRLTPVDYAQGWRLRCTGARFLDTSITRTAGAATTLLSTTGGTPGSIVWHSQVGGVGAVNLSWLERNFRIQVDSESTPQIEATGTEDWYDSAWYYGGRRDFSASFHTMIGTDMPPAPSQNVVGMGTDLLSKWGGVPFTTSAVMTVLPEPACTTGDRFVYAVLYYQ